MIQVQSHKGVTRFEYGEQNGSIGLGARVRLNVSKLGTEQLLNAVAGYILYLVYHLATAVVAMAGQAFSIFVGKITAHGLHHLIANEIL